MKNLITWFLFIVTSYAVVIVLIPLFIWTWRWRLIQKVLLMMDEFMKPVTTKEHEAPNH